MKKQKGVTALEYAILTAAIAGVLGIAILSFGEDIQDGIEDLFCHHMCSTNECVADEFTCTTEDPVDET